MDIEGMKMKMKCQVCGSEKVKVKTETEVYEYKGHKIPIDNFTRTICDNCGEEVASDESVKRSIPILRDAQRIIDGLLTSSEIKVIRKSLKMTQEEFGELLGGGSKAFARYETGRIKQSKSMDNLLRIIRAYPDALKTLTGELSGTGTEFFQVSDDKATYDPSLNSPFQFVFEGNTVRHCYE